MSRINFEIFLKDYFSGPIDRIVAKTATGFSKLNEKIGKIVAPKPLKNSLKGINDQIKELEEKIELSVDLKEIKIASREIERLQREKNKIERRGGIQKTGGFGNLAGGALNKLGGMAAGFFAADKLFDIGKSIVSNTAKFEKFEAVLRTTFQSSSKAKESLDQLTVLASETPFQIDELAESFVKLSNRGFNPTMDDMRSFGDIASSTGKSIDQFVEAALDAQMGEFERLKEFGIKANKVGNQYIFNFKGQKTAVDANEAAVKKYLVSLGKLKGVQGSMNAISKTTAGLISNLGDNWTRLTKAIGESNTGVIHDSIGFLNRIVKTTTDWFEIPMAEKLQSQKTELTNLLSTLASANLSESERLALINELNAKYPEILANIDVEKMKSEDLLKILDRVNKEYDKKIELSTEEQVKRKLEEEKTSYEQSLAWSRKKLDLLAAFEKASSEREKQAIVDLFNEDMSFFNKLSMHADTGDIGDLRNLFLSTLDQEEGLLAEVTKDFDKASKKVANASDDLSKMDLLTGGKKTESGIESDKTLNSGVNSLTGSSGVKNINVTFGKIYEDLIINSQTLPEALSENERLTTSMFLRVVNQANAMA